MRTTAPEEHQSQSPFSSRRLSQSLRGAGISPSVSSPSYPETHSAVSSSGAPEATAHLPLHATSGTHHIMIYIGSPPQRQTLIVDTGSRLMAFPCEPCAACGKHASPYFNPSLSTTDVSPTCSGGCFLELSKCSEFSERCILSQKYTEGSSWHAYELEDIVWFGTSDMEESVEARFTKFAVPYTFGCQTSETGLFRKQYADGILGLAMHDTSLIRALYEARAIPRNAFSLCFTKTGGQLSLGGTVSPQAKRHKEPMQFTTLHRDNGFYSLEVLHVRVNEFCVTCGHPTYLEGFSEGKGTILDSGTTDTYFPRSMAAPFSRAWEQITGFVYAARTRFYTYLEFQRLPRVSVAFRGNATLHLTPESYMEGVPVDEKGAPVPWKGNRELTNRIYVDEPIGAVLGANSMVGYDLLFDVQGHRVGLARADCAFEDHEGARASS